MSIRLLPAALYRGEMERGLALRRKQATTLLADVVQPIIDRPGWAEQDNPLAEVVAALPLAVVRPRMVGRDRLFLSNYSVSLSTPLEIRGNDPQMFVRVEFQFVLPSTEDEEGKIPGSLSFEISPTVEKKQCPSVPAEEFTTDRDPLMRLVREHLTKGNTVVTEELVLAVVAQCTFENAAVGRKTSVVTMILPNGFEVTESSACVDQSGFEHAVGIDICETRLKKRLEEHIAFCLQSMLFEVMADKDKPKQKDCAVHRRATEFTINGSKFQTVETNLTFESIVSLALGRMEKGSGDPTVTWRRAGLMGGVLRPGQHLTIIQGLVVTVAYTNNA